MKTKTKDEYMATFDVEYTVNVSMFYRVVADSIEEAENKVEALKWNAGHVTDAEIMRIDTIHEVE
jgi:hypothetical protein